MYSMMTAEQKDLVDLVRNVLTKELLPIQKEYELIGKFPMSVHDKLGELGFHGMDIPEEYGGLGLDPMTGYLIREEMGKIDAGFGFNYCIGKGTAATALKYGTEEQKKMFCDRLLNGGIGATCLTEPDAGSDVTAIRTTARKVGDEYILNGSKCFITNGPLANTFQVLAYTNKEAGSKGMSLFIVEKERGVQVGAKEDKMGFRMSETSDIVFEDVKVPAINLIGQEGQGYRLALGQVGKARLMTSAYAIGLAQSALDEAVNYAKIRISFGKPISKYQGVSFILADMAIQIEAARQLVIYGVRQMEAGMDYSFTASCAKTMAADVAMKVTTDAVQVFGGYGYSREYPLEQKMRDAKLFAIFEGTNQIQRMIIGQTLTK